MSDLTRDSSEYGMGITARCPWRIGAKLKAKVEIHARTDIGSAISGKGGRDLPWLGGGQSRWRSSRERRTASYRLASKSVVEGSLKKDDGAERINDGFSKRIRTAEGVERKERKRNDGDRKIDECQAKVVAGQDRTGTRTCNNAQGMRIWDRETGRNEMRDVKQKKRSLAKGRDQN
ncbi:hypothetical protein VM1G_11544 [Cytospora mali]|uniref:Uncharacterized protein n=1 Tax=Cytospora mali TaxID=578113 RepID=A0A194VXN0_CYTMA|nr:hypothetical protein VM1G_11544 [Valsa mali]